MAPNPVTEGPDPVTEGPDPVTEGPDPVSPNQDQHHWLYIKWDYRGKLDPVHPELVLVAPEVPERLDHITTIFPPVVFYRKFVHYTLDMIRIQSDLQFSSISPFKLVEQLCQF